MKINPIFLKTLFQLGLRNIFFVLIYRLAKRIGYYRHRLPIKAFDQSHFFIGTPEPVTKSSSSLLYFSYHEIAIPPLPDWLLNPWNNNRFSDTDKHWSEINDFIPELGDIKIIWEASRFDWMPKLAWQYRIGQKSTLTQIEHWLRNWSKTNSTNCGINWKCGQEVSLRCMNLLVGTLAIDDAFEKPTSTLLHFLKMHLERIEPTLHYAMAQDNNHGTSEAAALFTVGSYLAMHQTGKDHKQAVLWAKIGRKWLEDRTKKLISTDGSFSQQSVMYHRMVVDSLSFVELIRRKTGRDKFSPLFYDRAKAAVEWLWIMTDQKSGGAPNLGSNDGTYLFNLNDSSYRDFRPSLQLGAAVFIGRKLCNIVEDHPLLELFSFNSKILEPLPQKPSRLFENGGYACLTSDNGFAMMRLPVYRFRPSHADALHIDLWHDGINVIRDGGTYSYNTDSQSQKYFPGTRSHSTVCFDGRDQMPRLSRFLFGAWLKPDHIYFNENKSIMEAGYTDYKGSIHNRHVGLSDDCWVITDQIEGEFSSATIRWRLMPQSLELKETSLQGNSIKIDIDSDADVEISLIHLPESLYYLEKQDIPVLEIKCLEPVTVTTKITIG